MCLIKEDIIEMQSVRGKRDFYISQKAYCIMSPFKYFAFYLQVLNSVISMYKIERMNLANKLKQEIFSDLDRDIESMVMTPII